uniref:Uncharacterized protein n=1 Tax=Dunaliella tertiolecta TaxID=3047 RepID=A0A7S3VGS4_DUNTE|mmetsp:Transcript_26967/g.72867  ORF Transcript_26967/g.72867 Transcript_26967/m.72867 type:complete len:316 (+) Transcript_26967:74-1021(+)|eukprot:CAMPEP_0202351936 /NCGR_PEP_ID=MMETSP1126-20121109/8349_1 /ASSEMBLY_ACC=CAM_ASM_000457 /TAXON_ID=3047 /ORGANISM="Dunaliella tertiolecta, Strain CCMP1320" /LENGTH=315 /DNA_ID=CAMNT_0048944087 /DNA_START=50 /DNA_END=997 /DNA_ORIENTATION=+
MNLSVGSVNASTHRLPSIYSHSGCPFQYRKVPGRGCMGQQGKKRRCESSLRASAVSFDVANSASQLFEHVASTVTEPHPGWLTGAVLNSGVFGFGYKVLRKGLSPLGIANAWFLGASVFSAFGLGGYILVCLYFILGTLVTKLKIKQKQQEGIAEAKSGERGPASVWGSGIAGIACALLALYTGQYEMLQVGFVASFASKLCDTVSSEIGKAYGRTTYLATTFKTVPRGTEGAVSLEGTLAGLGAALGFAAVAYAANQVSLSGAGIVVGAALLANFFESYLGAALQGRMEWLSNDLVNMVQISLAAAMAIGASTL